ncbi:MAG: patatin-like phospholipase family protein [Solirubrobacterales bacterium]
MPADRRSQPPAETADPSLPIRLIPGDAPEEAPAGGLGLCLSGGGYRAMLFHLGALWRLNQLGYLPRLDRVSSVSGGSIVAAVLGARWERLGFGDGGVAVRFEAEVVAPVRALADRTIDVPAVLLGLATPASIGGRLTATYRRRLYGGATLQDLPPDQAGPRFVINATNLQSGVLWRFSRPYAWDYRVGKIERPAIPLATAVAASSAFPPLLAPLRLRFADSDFVPGSGDDLQRPPFTTRPTLADGGVYDNLGLETVWKRCATVLVSDAGGAMPADEGALGRLHGWRWRDWGSQAVRVLKTIDSQVRNLRKRQLIAGFTAAPGSRAWRQGTYWGIRSHVRDYGLAGSLAVADRRAEALADVPTRLAKLDARTQEELVNWGYAICDTALRKWVLATDPGTPSLPYPGSPIDR